MANKDLKISVVTPSFNQVSFLEAALMSVLGQGYPNLEYIVIDGQSTDRSIEIIQSYDDHLYYWCSEPDTGQYDAINKGFMKSTGDIMAWLNSDDMYTPWAFKIVNEIFFNLPEVEWLTTLSPLLWSSSGSAIYCAHRGGFTRQGFFRGENLPVNHWFALGPIQQESVFWRRSLWKKAGGYVNTSYPLAADFELWARFFQHANLHTVSVPLGGFRFHGAQKSVLQNEEYANEAGRILKLYGGHPRSKLQDIVIKVVKDYIRLPHSLRALALRFGLKSPHYYCTHSTTENCWVIKQI